MHPITACWKSKKKVDITTNKVEEIPKDGRTEKKRALPSLQRDGSALLRPVECPPEGLEGAEKGPTAREGKTPVKPLRAPDGDQGRRSGAGR